MKMRAGMLWLVGLLALCGPAFAQVGQGPTPPTPQSYYKCGDADIPHAACPTSEGVIAANQGGTGVVVLSGANASATVGTIPSGTVGIIDYVEWGCGPCSSQANAQALVFQFYRDGQSTPQSISTSGLTPNPGSALACPRFQTYAPWTSGSSTPTNTFLGGHAALAIPFSSGMTIKLTRPSATTVTENVGVLIRYEIGSVPAPPYSKWRVATLGTIASLQAISTPSGTLTPISQPSIGSGVLRRVTTFLYGGTSSWNVFEGDVYVNDGAYSTTNNVIHYQYGEEAFLFGSGPYTASVIGQCNKSYGLIWESLDYVWGFHDFEEDGGDIQFTNGLTLTEGFGQHTGYGMTGSPGIAQWIEYYTQSTAP